MNNEKSGLTLPVLTFHSSLFILHFTLLPFRALCIHWSAGPHGCIRFSPWLGLFELSGRHGLFAALALIVLRSSTGFCAFYLLRTVTLEFKW
jgi:hypothetical protein